MESSMGAPLIAVVMLAMGSMGAQSEGSGTMMKAVRYHAFGGPEVLAYEDAPKPSPGVGEVLIRVHAAGVNPVDWKIRKGRSGAAAPAAPMIPGFDVSGDVEAVGPGVTKFKAGDEVYSFLSLTRGGGYAEFVAAPVEEVARKPKSLDHVHAAGVPLAALTAWQALFDTAKLRAGQTVLIHAGAGGVGHFAVQLAKAKGARVIATASAGNHDFLKELGADEVVDYRAQKFEDVAKDVDVVLDSIGGETLERSYRVVKRGGFIVSIVAQPDTARLREAEINSARILVKPNAMQLAEIGSLIDSGKVKPHVSETLTLEEAKKAHEMSETGRTRGKIVLRVR